MTRKPQALVRWTFDNGRTVALPLSEFEAQLQRQYHRMAASSDPVLRREGSRLLRLAAEQAAAKQVADAMAGQAARRPRPGSRSPIRDRILAAMRQYKAGGTEFKTFMQAWERDAIDGLRLSRAREDAYFVDDENSGTPARRYTWRSLQKLYSAATNHRQRR